MALFYADRTRKEGSGLEALSLSMGLVIGIWVRAGRARRGEARAACVWVEEWAREGGSEGRSVEEHECSIRTKTR